MFDQAQGSETRKKLGAFYTQAPTAAAIAALAIRNGGESVLDPCFGGCAFLEAVRSRLSDLGNDAPMRRVYGVDVDPAAVAFLERVPGARLKQFLVRDFWDVSPENFGRQFDVVLGNPPFVRHHLMSSDSISRAQKQMEPEQAIPRTADAWLYFFHHSLRFLRAGGCLALVLPSAFLNADYARSARRVIATRFASAELYLVRERLFPEALESPVIVIARGFQEKHTKCQLSVVESSEEIVSAAREGAGASVDLKDETAPWRVALLPAATRRVLSVVTHRPEVAQLGTVAIVHIGVVTGANRFFVLSPSEARATQISSSNFHPILSTGKQLRGLSIGAADMRRLNRADQRTLLLVPRQPLGKRVSAYTESAAAATAKLAYKCHSRPVWYQLTDTKVSQAFLSYVNDYGPRLVLNDAGVLSTNAIHRVWWRDGSRATAKGLSLAMLSSLGYLSAELYGRTTGGGALKLEPSEAAALWLVTRFRDPPRMAEAFTIASRALRAGDDALARSIADDAVLRGELGLGAPAIAELRSACDFLRALRRSVAARGPTAHSSSS